MCSWNWIIIFIRIWCFQSHNPLCSLIIPIFVQHTVRLFYFPPSVHVCLCEDGILCYSITLNDLPNHVVLTMTGSSTQLTDTTLLKITAITISSSLAVCSLFINYAECCTWLQDYCKNSLVSPVCWKEILIKENWWY